MNETLQILDLRIAYRPHWVGIEDGRVVYDHFEIGSRHEIEASYLPRELHMQLLEFVKQVELAHDEA